MGYRYKAKVMEDYSTEKGERHILMVETKKIEDETIILYVYLPNNLDNKLEEYLKALG